MTNVVGICGAIGSGKTTLAELLVQHDAEHAVHIETSAVVIELGDAFNAAWSAALPRPNSADLRSVNPVIEQLLPHLSAMAERDLTPADIAIDPEDARTNPLWYDKLHVYLDQLSADPALAEQAITPANKSHYRTLLQWIGGYFLYRLDDPLLWYKELFRRVAELPEGTLIAMTAPRQPAEAQYVQSRGGKVLRIHRPGKELDEQEATERRIAEIRADSEIQNDGTLEQLDHCAAALHQDLKADTLSPAYRASAY